MKTFSFLPDSFVSAFGWTLLHAVWQGFAIVALAAFGLFLLRRRSSTVKYWTGIGAMLAQVVASSATFVLYYEPILSPSRLTGISRLPQNFLQNINYQASTMPWYRQILWFLQTHLDTVVLFWVIGASVLLVRLVGSWIYVQQLKAEGIQLTEARIQALFRKITQTVGVRQTVHLFESVRVSTPMVIGFLRPVVLLPVGLVTGLSTKQIEAILAHELAHVKRYDYLINLLQSLVEIVYFFHPALWWLSSRIRIEREHCCDDVAVRTCGDKMAFAQALAEVEAYRQAPALAMAFASQKGALLLRVKRILGVAEKPAQRFNPNALLLVVLLACGVSVYAIQQDEKQKTKKATTTKKRVGRTQISINDDKKISQIIWNGRQLTVQETKEIQALKEAIDAGTQELSAVSNTTYRDVIRDLIDSEKNLNIQLDGLGENLANLNVNLGNLSEIAMPDLDLAVFPSNSMDSLQEIKMKRNHRKIDSLSRLIAPQHQKMENLRLTMEQHEFNVQELERQMETIEWKRSKARDERIKTLDKRSKIMYQDDQKNKLNEAEVEKQLAQFEQQIKQQEGQLLEYNKQIADLSQKIKNARQPLEDLEKQMEELNAINERFSEEIDKFSREIDILASSTPQMVLYHGDSPDRPARPARPSKPGLSAPKAPRPPSAPAPAAFPSAPSKPKAPIKKG